MDVEKALNEDDEYGDDGFEEENQHVAKKPSSGSILAAAATVALEEARATKKLMSVAASEIQRSTSSRAADEEEDDALAQAAKEVYREERGGRDDEDDDEDDDEGAESEAKKALNAVCRVGCFRGNLKQVRDVLDKGADLKSKDRHGWNCLHWAASSNSVDIVRFLLKEASAELPTRALRAFVNGQASDTGWTPIMVAVIKGAVDSLEVLLDCRLASLDKKCLLGETAADCVPADKTSTSNRMRKLLGVDATPPMPVADTIAEAASFSRGEEKEEDGEKDNSRRK